MSISISQRQPIGSVFAGNKFIIPSYQRKYSWANSIKNEGQLKQLWDDISDSKGLMKHYFGTLLFKEGVKKGLTETYEIIDGQQRITTLYILLSEIIEKLPQILSNGENKKEYQDTFIGSPGQMKLIPHDTDKSIFETIIFDFGSIDKNNLQKRSHKLLYNAKYYFKSLLLKYNQNELEDLINFIQSEMEVLVLTVQQQADAIKMFSIINDRGLPLNELDKTKSTLMLYSTKYLQSSLNNHINSCFEKIFDSYDDIILESEGLGILTRFSENTIFTYHYLTTKYTHFKSDWNYRNGAEQIFKNLKNECHNLRTDIVRLKTFIEDYTKDFCNFSESFSQLIKEIKTKSFYHYPFLYLDFGATMYPLIISVYRNGNLDSLLGSIEKTELRVYKFNRTEPVSNIYDLASRVAASNPNETDIEISLQYIRDRFMNDTNIRTLFSGAVYGKQGIKYLLLRYNQKIDNNNKTVINPTVFSELQEEHIFSQKPSFDTLRHGFNTQEDYDIDIHKMGNLTLYEPDNSNDTPINKSGKYLNSNIYITNELGSKIQHNGFSKTDIDLRTQELLDFCINNF